MHGLWAWIQQNSGIVAAAATVGLAFFAAVQLVIENRRSKASREAARIEARSWTWLARRNCEAALQQAVGNSSAWDWRGSVQGGLDAMQRNFLRALQTGSRAKGRYAKAVESAFSDFLAFADRVNDDTRFRVSVSGFRNEPQPSVEDRRAANAAARDSLTSLLTAINALEVIAPRTDHESTIPDRNELPLLEVRGDTELPIGHPMPTNLE